MLATHTTLTYGTCPDENEFYAAWAREMDGNGRFKIRGGATGPDPLEGDWHAEELYAEIAECCDDLAEGRIDIGDEDDEASLKLDSCSAVLTHLGFEWV